MKSAHPDITLVITSCGRHELLKRRYAAKLPVVATHINDDKYTHDSTNFRHCTQQRIYKGGSVDENVS